MNRQEKRRKPESEAYEALLSILRSNKLGLGQYREVVKVRVPKLRRRDKNTRKMKTLTNVMVQMMSAPVCCLSDIPIAHLSYQARRYGKLAIGFHREAVVRHGFNPVFYALHHAQVLQSIRQGFRQLRNVDVDSIVSEADDIESEVDKLECEHGHEVKVDLNSEFRHLRLWTEDILDDISSAQENLEKFLAFVKTFAPREFSTIYCEREWRSTNSFSFSENDVAMIVLPKGDASSSYFRRFVSDRATRLKLPRSIPVVPWEDLVEH